MIRVSARRTSALLVGSVMHARNDEHARRAFRYPVYVASIDLAELPVLERELRLFSHGGRNLFALHDRDYEGGAAGLPTALADLLAANRLPVPHTTRLVTNLRVAGYVFNPVSFFLNYDATGALVSVIAEVNNTYGGRRRYVLGPERRIREPFETAHAGSLDRRGGTDPATSVGRHLDPRARLDSDVAARGNAEGERGRVGFRHIRELFVSPFLHGPAVYDFWFDAPLDGDRLAIAMHVRRPGGERIFAARLEGTRRPLTDRALLAAALRYPLMTAQVIGLIHLQAITLRLRGVPYFRPGPGHAPRPHAPPVRSHSSAVPAQDRSSRLK